ncbi:MAG: DNA polymerase I [Clostridia bacterium]|nr:DNA polymerase I [Clostridia bacterium]
MKTLLAVDGNSILNRAFYGIRALSTSSGQPTNAVYGMITMLTRQLEKYSPDMCAVAFDLRAPTFRHKMYDGYKANRKGMPEELAAQMEYAHKVVRALGFHIIEKEGYEADDILGTLAAYGDAAGDVQTLIMTGDRDSLQLISEHTAVLLATNNDYVYFDRDAFFEKYGVEPSQFVDVKAIMGDSSDNIPGIAGIGEKGALALISRFGSLNAVYESYESADGIKPAMLAKLAAGKESAFISQALAEICRTVPGMPTLAELETNGINRADAKKLFTELEFGALIKKMGLDSVEVACDIEQTSCEYKAENGVEAFVSILSADSPSISINDTTAAVFDGSKLCAIDTSSVPFDAVAAAAPRLACYDCKTLYELCDKRGVRMRNVGFDVMLAAYVLDSSGSFDISRLITLHLGELRDENVSDAVYVYRLREVLSQKLKEQECEGLFFDIEMPLAGVLADMEEAGFLIDPAGLAKYGEALSDAANALTERIYFAAGEEFNINSPKQLGEILFEKMGLPAGKKTKTGYSTNAEILEKLAPKYPIVADILEYRQLTKLIGTYVTGLLKVADGEGRIHTKFKQTGTATGRLSSADPNLQNIPIRTELGRELRKYFLPRENYLLVDADYSQIELRLLACIANDENMISAFLSGEDIHTSTASAVFGVPIELVTPLLRKRAKAVNFGIVYGIGEFSLSQDLGIGMKQAKEYIESYLATYPRVRDYLQSVIEEAKKEGYVKTLYGRRRYIPELNEKNGAVRKFGERVAMNSPIQGSAADIIKIAMINVDRRLKEEKLDARMILQVHDELIIEAHRDCADRAADILREEMEAAAKLAVPLSVELSIGSRWYET